MFSRDIDYKNFQGVKRTQRLHFNLTVPEVMAMEFTFEDGFEGYIERASADATENGNNKRLFVMFELIIAKSYGRFKDDGETFTKNPLWYPELVANPPYEELFLWIFGKESNAATFYTKVMPENLEERIAAIRGTDKAAIEDAPKKRIQDADLGELEALVAKLKLQKPANEA